MAPRLLVASDRGKSVTWHDRTLQHEPLPCYGTMLSKQLKQPDGAFLRTCSVWKQLWHECMMMTVFAARHCQTLVTPKVSTLLVSTKSLVFPFQLFWLMAHTKTRAFFWSETTQCGQGFRDHCSPVLSIPTGVPHFPHPGLGHDWENFPPSGFFPRKDYLAHYVHRFHRMSFHERCSLREISPRLMNLFVVACFFKLLLDFLLCTYISFMARISSKCWWDRPRWHCLLHFACCRQVNSCYRKTSSISRTKSQNLNVSCLLLQWSLPNSLKPGVKLRMKM